MLVFAINACDRDNCQSSCTRETALASNRKQNVHARNLLQVMVTQRRADIIFSINVENSRTLTQEGMQDHHMFNTNLYTWLRRTTNVAINGMCA